MSNIISLVLKSFGIHRSPVRFRTDICVASASSSRPSAVVGSTGASRKRPTQTGKKRHSLLHRRTFPPWWYAPNATV